MGTTLIHKMPETYETQDGCWNCYWCFIKTDYDDLNHYYCRRKAPKRPKCNSGLMGESFCSGADWRDDYSQIERVWREWANGRQVAPWGKCEKHRRRERLGEYVEHINDNLPIPAWRRKRRKEKP